MAKAWTTREQKECSATYSAEGMQAAIAITGRTSTSIKNRMAQSGVRCAHSNKSGLTPFKHSVFAEDVAKMIELESSGVTHSLIGEYFSKSRRNVSIIIQKAKKNGFNAYPLRNKQ